jgi:hypothetical protein
VLGKARELASTPGIAFSLQGWLLVIAFVIVGGAVVGSVLSEDMAARERTREA